ncbi:uncharacterized protein KQ657_004130 [Scheffersomyces spartinae]|uniref:BHLH domain-containing protein n=1 Tax=Scheffersomyces spartinae TaxID=45513 RepID=A0A9P8AKD1_9ASCO|nr:uncharacterized protein KQ657_004130 [Scheffersomyces spartinae]KAG7195017.1 hypothetical protein KQ657_004130 [Scheffersomyces spartinae]
MLKHISRSHSGGGSGLSSGSITKSTVHPHTRRGSGTLGSKPNIQDYDEDDDDDGDGHERKRRDNNNEKIQELLSLIPQTYFEEDESIKKEGSSIDDLSGGASGGGGFGVTSGVKASGTKDGKPNKGQILTKSLDYMKDLQQAIDQNNQEEVQLLMKLELLKRKKHIIPSNTPIKLGHTSGQLALGKIGVGSGELVEEYFKTIIISSAHTKRGIQ